MSPNNNLTHLSIADIQIDLRSPLTVREMHIDELLEPFFGQPERPAGRIQLQWEESDDILRGEGEMVYDPGIIWRMFRNGETWCAEISYGDQPAGAGNEEVRCLLRANNAWDTLTMTEKRYGTGGWHSLLALGAGELIIRSAMALSGGIVLHAAGIDDNGRGIVFSGHSGAGKSTQLDFWLDEDGVIPMTDDRVAIRVSGDHAVCYGTPWGGMPDIASNHAAPLKA
ncbi:MAG: hypothetical protein MJA29_05055, partial [Candidatus Omnitrophica bacterium]|nr:hypothetical protein [Candidatus Omnitrophota bacterium]